MTELKAIREMVGLSQLEMARLLGLKKSSICMAETGQRKLPEKARNLLFFISDVLPENEEENQLHYPDRELVQKEINNLKAKLTLLELELETKESKARKFYLFKSVCQKIEVAFGAQLSTSNLKWIDALLSEKELQLEKEEQTPTIFLKARITGLKSMIVFLNRT
jgi:transcriptional regulator with XRE-family HTH domain